jgi:mono/diheme cytochrome c family protein
MMMLISGRSLMKIFGNAVISGALVVLTTMVIAIASPAAGADDAATYKGKCASCHGADGAGSAVGLKLGAHDFRGDEVRKMTDDQLTAITAKGKNKMPAYEKQLKPEEIKGLIAYIRAMKK